ncbi:MAG: (d)CMP kinase [Candidatus Eisenbacteria bacterium]
MSRKHILPNSRGRKLKRIVITIDGPAGSGKSTTAKLVARRLGYLYLDTGAMYRAMTLKALRTGIDLDDPEVLAQQARDTDVTVETEPDGTRVVLDGEDVTDRLRELEVTQKSSVVAAAKGVRTRMVELQRKIGANGGIVAEGRDIGSVVFPDAEVKIYLDADLSARASRRKKELDAGGNLVDITRIERDMGARDAYDSGREHSPLVVPAGAIIVDTTNLTIDGQVERVVEEAEKVIGGEGS